MEGLKIITNGQWRQFKTREEVPAGVLTDYFDHLDSDAGGDDYFFQYRKRWYHISDFVVVPAGCSDELSQWDGYLNDSFFSGAVIRIAQDQETYQVGTFLS